MRQYNHKISERANENLNKRERIVRNQRRNYMIAFIILVTLGILFGTSINTFASSKTDTSSYHKYYTSIQIEAGDTLWDIADRYTKHLNISKPEYIDEICQINGISEDKIITGEYIVVPYYSNEIK